MQYWFFPVFSGDIRLESVNDGIALSVVMPTASEKKALKRFWTVAIDKGWIDKAPRVKPKNETRVVLSSTMDEIAPELSRAVHGDTDTWTAVRFSGGKVQVFDDEEEARKELTKEPEDHRPVATAAATVRQPARGCPAPEPCERRASEVLKAFSTVSQWQRWKREGKMLCIGNATGRAYFVHHRNHAAQLGMGHSVSMVSTGEEICIWDGGVPAEEEALAAKLAIEHREKWLHEKAKPASEYVADLVPEIL